MANNRRIHVGEMGAAMENMLEIYSQDVQNAVANVTETWMKTLVRKTKATAPKGRRNGSKRILPPTTESYAVQRPSVGARYERHGMSKPQTTA